MSYIRKIYEFDPVFSFKKIEKGWFYKTKGSLYFFPKDGPFHKMISSVAYGILHCF